MSAITPLRFVRTDNGMRRVYYRGADRHLYCFQVGVRRNSFDLFACSADGEPEFRVSRQRFAIDRWPSDNSGTARAFAGWASSNIMPTTEEQDR